LPDGESARQEPRRPRIFRTGHAHEDIAVLLGSIEPKGRCLDLPAGRGVNVDGIRRAGFEPVAADLYPELVKDKTVEAVRADFTEPMPFEDGSFAAVLCSEGIEHCPDQLKLLQELARVLQPGGTLLLTTPNALHLGARVAHLLTGYYSFSRTLICEMTAVTGKSAGRACFGHVFVSSYLILRTLVRTAGFDRIRVTTAKYSVRAMLLAPLLWLPVRLATWRRMQTRRLRKRPAIAREMTAHLMSADMLFGKKLILLAEKEGEASPEA
jgi:SAM-dependent methyltransferase